MFFLIDVNLKIIIGWSPKSGCSHIKKIIRFLQTNNFDHETHIPDDIGILPNDIENYVTILIIRNPYERLISGFLDKYRKSGEFIQRWKHPTITFSKFIDELIKGDWNMIQEFHFKPQMQDFDEKILKSKELKIYDIKNIDYNLIETLYNKKIPEKILNFKFNHERKSGTILEKYVHDLDMQIYYNYSVPTKYFYNEDLKHKVHEFYKNDFIFFNSHGFYLN